MPWLIITVRPTWWRPMARHDCDYRHEGQQCPKLGIYAATAHLDPSKPPNWYCAYHRDPANRGHGYADGSLLRAISEDIVAGQQGRGTVPLGRETDALIAQELARLDLHRGPTESRENFVARCLAQTKSRGMKTMRDRLTAPERAMILASGEDPDIWEGSL